MPAKILKIFIFVHMLIECKIQHFYMLCVTVGGGVVNNLNDASHLPHLAESFLVLNCTSCELTERSPRRNYTFTSWPGIVRNFLILDNIYIYKFLYLVVCIRLQDNVFFHLAFVQIFLCFKDLCIINLSSYNNA